MTFKFADILLLICYYIIMTCGLLSASFVKIIYWKRNLQVRWCVSINITIWGVIHNLPRASPVAQLVKNQPAVQETLVQFLGWEDPWRRERLPTLVFMPGESPWTEEPGRLQFSQFSSVAQSCLTLRHHGLQHGRLPCPWPTPGAYSKSCHRVCDAIQLSHPLLSPSPPSFNLSQHQVQWVSTFNQVAKLLELQLQHQSFQWIFRTDFL